MTHLEYANALRRIADWIEEHPELPLPYQTALDYYSGTDQNTLKKDTLLLFVKAFGSCNKKFNDTYIVVDKNFGGITLRAVAYREAVCERVVVGTRSVPEQYIPGHEEEIVEWKCPESLLKTE